MTRLTLFNRASNGDLVLASYTGRKSYCWIWAVTLSRELFGTSIVPKSQRRGQWHHYFPMFGRTLIISRQDYHRDPRHQERSQ
jgi:hypothetical protein